MHSHSYSGSTLKLRSRGWEFPKVGFHVDYSKIQSGATELNNVPLLKPDLDTSIMEKGEEEEEDEGSDAGGE